MADKIKIFFIARFDIENRETVIKTPSLQTILHTFNTQDTTGPARCQYMEGGGPDKVLYILNLLMRSYAMVTAMQIN